MHFYLGACVCSHLHTHLSSGCCALRPGMGALDGGPAFNHYSEHKARCRPGVLPGLLFLNPASLSTPCLSGHPVVPGELQGSQPHLREVAFGLQSLQA